MGRSTQRSVPKPTAQGPTTSQLPIEVTARHARHAHTQRSDRQCTYDNSEISTRIEMMLNSPYAPCPPECEWTPVPAYVPQLNPHVRERQVAGIRHCEYF